MSRFTAVGARLIASGVTLACVLAGIQLGRADAPGSCRNGEHIAEAARFVAEETTLLVPEICVRFVDLRDRRLVPASTHEGAHQGAVAALFLPLTGEILLAADLDLTTPLARSYLVHELVHAQQFARRADERASCLGALEGEAYNLQALYLSMRGQRDQAFLFQVHGMLQSACGYSN